MPKWAQPRFFLSQVLFQEKHGSFWQVECKRFILLMKYFFFFATAAVMTEIVSFSHFHNNHCYGPKFLQHDYSAYQSKLSLKKWSQLSKLIKKNCGKVTSSYRLLRTHPSNRVKKQQILLFWIFTNICHISEWI